MSTDQVALAVTTAVTLVGLYFANSLRLRTRAEVESDVASKRFDAYAALWSTMASASPMRDAPLTKAERVRLFDDFTRWYFEGGHGMLLTEQSRNIYLTAKRNLTCPDGELVPDALATRVKTGGEAVRGEACKKQLSLLRSSLRADIRIYTDPYDESPSHEDVAFLKACKVKLDQQPWKRALRVDMVAAQLARDHAQFEQAVGDADAVRRTRLAGQLVLDTRFFIPAYGAVFAGLMRSARPAGLRRGDPARRARGPRSPPPGSRSTSPRTAGRRPPSTGIRRTRRRSRRRMRAPGRRAEPRSRSGSLCR